VRGHHSLNFKGTSHGVDHAGELNESAVPCILDDTSAMLRDFDLLGVRSVAELAKQDPVKMYARLERLTGQRQDPCVLDTFQAAVAQARNPRLPAEKCLWWYWSRKRKA